MLRLFGKIRWRKLLKGALVGVGLFFIVGQLLYMLLLHAGPSVETVRQKVADAMGVPSLGLVYVGGCLRRESSVLFRHEGNSSLMGKYEEVSPKSQTYEIVMDFLKRMNVNMDMDASIKILKFPWEFDTVVCVICVKERWVVFYGTAVM